MTKLDEGVGTLIVLGEHHAEVLYKIVAISKGATGTLTSKGDGFVAAQRCKSVILALEDGRTFDINVTAVGSGNPVVAEFVVLG